MKLITRRYHAEQEGIARTGSLSPNPSQVVPSDPRAGALDIAVTPDQAGDPPTPADHDHEARITTNTHEEQVAAGAPGEEARERARVMWLLRQQAAQLRATSVEARERLRRTQDLMAATFALLARAEERLVQVRDHIAQRVPHGLPYAARLEETDEAQPNGGDCPPSARAGSTSAQSIALRFSRVLRPRRGALLALAVLSVFALVVAAAIRSSRRCRGDY